MFLSFCGKYIFFSIFVQSCIYFAFQLKIDSGFWELANTALLIILVVIFQVFCVNFILCYWFLFLKKKKAVKGFDFEIKHILFI